MLLVTLRLPERLAALLTLYFARFVGSNFARRLAPDRHDE